MSKEIEIFCNGVSEGVYKLFECSMEELIFVLNELKYNFPENAELNFKWVE